jgi:tRNA dimethylallyltransferase
VALGFNIHCKTDRSGMTKPTAILIAGPTASGKSALGLAIAERFGGIVINADSMQVYRDLRVITARPTPEDEARAPHLLYGHVDAGENYSVGHWLTDARTALREAADRGKLPIFVGGTGLYFKALTRGLTAIPPIPPAMRENVRARLDQEGAPALHAELARRDPPSAERIRPADRTRIVRALEVIEATGRSLFDWHRDGMRPILPAAVIFKCFLSLPREVWRERIDRRFDLMLAAGALDEVRALDARQLDPNLPAMKAHGVPWLRRHLAGEMSLAAAAEQAKRDTRRYAKRQLTWFRHQLPDWSWISPDEAKAELARILKP